MAITSDDRRQITDAIGLLLKELDTAETARMFFATDVESTLRPLDKYQSFAPGDHLMFSFVIQKGGRKVTRG